MGTNFCQAATITCPQEGSLVQNSSNLNGIARKQEVEFVFKEMGLWSEL
jgi:hypothetical protein